MSSLDTVVTLLREITALQNLGFLFTGIYWHEFVLHGHFDWKLLNRSEKDRAPAARIAKWSYLLCRLLLIVYSAGITVLSSREQVECHFLLKLLTSTGFLGVICSSLLLSIRVAAVWAWNKGILALLGTILCAMLGSAIFFTVKADSTYSSDLEICALSGVHNDYYPSIITTCGDGTILIFLLLGLQRNWRDAKTYRMWNVLWSQGLIYLVLAVAVDVPLVVLLSLNLNAIINSIVVIPQIIILGIGATRMFRSLNTAVRGEAEDPEHFTNGTSHAMRVPRTLTQGDVQLKELRRS
ncbi:unnamed protein product [Peniophora sp. CBMAI 1063]|nr:unnamed protein product [Peniophora sp. CBMAI 1063]